MVRTHRLVQLLVIGTALVGLGACGGGDDDANTGSGGSGGAVGSGGATASGGSGAAGTGGKGGGTGGTTGSGGKGGSGGASGSGGSGSGGMGSGGTGSGGTGSGGMGGDDGGMMGGALKLTSTAFTEGMMIDMKYRCDGPSPAVSWTGGMAMSFAIVLKDVTPGFSMDFIHWVIYDIPKATTSLPENVPEGAMPAMPAGAKQVANWENAVGYSGPCGPAGTNTYELTLYAIPTATLAGVTASSTGAQVITAIEGAATDMSTITVMSTP